MQGKIDLHKILPSSSNYHTRFCHHQETTTTKIQIKQTCICEMGHLELNEEIHLHPLFLEFTRQRLHDIHWESGWRWEGKIVITMQKRMKILCVLILNAKNRGHSGGTKHGVRIKTHIFRTCIFCHIHTLITKKKRERRESFSERYYEWWKWQRYMNTKEKE